MRIDIITIFPEIFDGPLSKGIINRAIKKNKLTIKVHNLRNYSKDGRVDDYPYGGGPGMILKAEPIFACLKEINGGFVILLSAQGVLFNQELARKLSEYEHLVFICGHYSGVDERVKTKTNLELSIGNYVLSGGEFASLVVIDAVVRLIHGVIGNPLSLESDSFSKDCLLGWPQYTRPYIVDGLRVPEVLLSGNHNKIAQWRKQEAAKLTQHRQLQLLHEEKY